MFSACVKCDRVGQDCVPNLMALPFADLLEWWKERQRFLGWTNQTLADKSNIPVGTINRIKAGEDDCKYSTIHSILIALIGGTTDEFSCTEQVEKELRQMEQLEQQAAKLTDVEARYEALKERMNSVDELHRRDIRIMKEEYQEQINFLKDELKAWRSVHQCK